MKKILSYFKTHKYLREELELLRKSDTRLREAENKRVHTIRRNMEVAHILLDRIFYHLVKDSEAMGNYNINKRLENDSLNRQLAKEIEDNKMNVRTYLLELRTTLQKIK